MTSGSGTLPDTALEQALARCISGRSKALKAIYTEMSPNLFALCLAITGSQSRAERALESAFCAIYEQAGAYAFAQAANLNAIEDGDAGLVSFNARSWMITQTRLSALQHKAAHLSGETPRVHSYSQDALRGNADNTLQTCLDRMAPEHVSFLRHLYLTADLPQGLQGDDQDPESVAFRESLADLAIDLFAQQEVVFDLELVAAGEQVLFPRSGTDIEMWQYPRGDLEEAWLHHLAALVYELTPCVPPDLVWVRINKDLFSRRRPSLISNVLPYAFGGGIAAMIAWSAMLGGYLTLEPPSLIGGFEVGGFNGVIEPDKAALTPVQDIEIVAGYEPRFSRLRISWAGESLSALKGLALGAGEVDQNLNFGLWLFVKETAFSPPAKGIYLGEITSNTQRKTEGWAFVSMSNDAISALSGATLVLALEDDSITAERDLFISDGVAKARLRRP